MCAISQAFIHKAWDTFYIIKIKSNLVVGYYGENYGYEILIYFGKIMVLHHQFSGNWYCIETYELKQNYGSIPKTINVQVNLLIARLFQSKDNI